MTKRVIREGSACFTTHVVNRHTSIFTSSDYMDVICNALRYAQTQRGLQVYGYVIMPDHLHLLTSIPGSAMQLGNILTALRQYTAVQLLELLQRDTNRKQWAIRQLEQSQSDASVWEPASHPVDASDSGLFEQKLVYIHHNPVRAGFVREPRDWRYSSAAFYFGNEDLTGPPPLRVDWPWGEGVRRIDECRGNANDKSGSVS